MGAWTILFAALSVARHRAFWTGRFDLGNMVQAVWSTAHGRPLETTEVGGEQISRLGAHADPILVLFAPLWRLWPSPEMLLVSQAALVSLGALPAFWLGRRWLRDDRLALAVAATYLLMPALDYAVLFDFHPVTLAAPALLGCIWAAEARRPGTFCVLGALACLTQEQVGLAVAGVAIWMAVRTPAMRRVGIWAAAIAGTYSVLAIMVVIPAFSADGGNPHGNRFGELGGSIGEVALTILTRPWEVPMALATPSHLLYLPMLLLPVLLLPLLAPGLVAAALPQLGLNLLAAGEPPRMVDFHYAVTLVPFLVAGAALGLSRLQARRRPERLVALARRPRVAAGALVGAVLVAGALQGPIPIWSWLPAGLGKSPHHGFVPDAEARALARAVDLVPDGVAVSASNAPGAHLSARRSVYLFPRLEDAEWVVISAPARSAGDLALRRGTLEPELADIQRRRLARSGVWELVYREADVEVYRRTAPQASAPSTGGERAT